MLIVDNSDKPDLELHNHLINKFKKLHIIANGKNLGIARALNQGLKYAFENGYEYALLLDQDSMLLPDTIGKLIRCLNTYKMAFIAAPWRIDINTAEKQIKKEFTERLTTATSGSLLRLSYLNTIGYHDEKLFIDMVDHEYCLRACKKGFQVIVVNNARMHHRLGKMQKKVVCGIPFYPTHHAAIRRYYKARNGLYIWGKYLFKYPRFVIPGIINFCIEYIEIIMFEREKRKKTVAIIQGFYDCFRSHFGEKKIYE